MSKYFTRSLELTTVKAEKVFYKDGQLQHEELTPFTTYDKVTEKRINKYYEKELNEGESLVIKSKEVQEVKRKITLEKFIENSEEM